MPKAAQATQRVPLRITLPPDLWEQVKQASGPEGLSAWFERVLGEHFGGDPPETVTLKPRATGT